MDPLKQLRIEFNVIQDTMSKYQDDDSTWNYLRRLDEALDDYNGEAIDYCLGRLIDWYDEHIEEIREERSPWPELVKKQERIYELLIDLKKRLLEYDYSMASNKEKRAIVSNGPKKIFLSHRSSDKGYADALQKLIVGLGVKNDQLIYTSHPLHKIPLGAKIYDYLRDNINDQVFMIILMSKDYLQSPACLSEMGAAWVMKTDYVGVYTPGFDFEDPRFHEIPFDNTKMGAVLKNNPNCKAGIIELKNKIVDFFGLQVDEQTSTYLIDDFMKDIERMAQ